MKKCDVAIIGAGPAGTMAAKSLSAKGFETILFEKDKLPRYKVCGGAIPEELVHEIKLPEEFIDRNFNYLTLHHSDGSVFDRKGKGACLWRSKLDSHMTQMAVDDGAILLDSTKIIDAIHDENRQVFILKSKDEEYSSKILIIADGAPSLFATKFNFPKIPSEDMAQTMTYEIEFESKKVVDDRFGDDKMHLWFGKDIVEIGYGWIFPKSKAVSVGWGCQVNVLKNIQERLANFLEVVKEFTKGGKIIRKAAHMVPTGIRKEYARDGLILIGDSAGFVDPLSGKGIAYGAISGMLLGNIVKRALESEDLSIIPQKFEKKLNREFLNALRAKKNIQADVYKNDINIKRFLELWNNHRSTEIALKLWKKN